eukprot:SAG31_NODE_19597_length_597_cov_1.142570_1_plen_62_part_10
MVTVRDFDPGCVKAATDKLLPQVRSWDSFGEFSSHNMRHVHARVTWKDPISCMTAKRRLDNA